MENKELTYNLLDFALENNIPVEKCRPIPKSELVVGQTYNGVCRNSSTATWNGNCFQYQRYKFGEWYTDWIYHYEDDNGYDVFVPIAIIE